MHQQLPSGNDEFQMGNGSQNVVSDSGLCPQCLARCVGNGDGVSSSLRGCEILDRDPLGEPATGGDENYPVGSLQQALELRRRGYIVIPDPEDPAIQAAFQSGVIRQFERHNRLGLIDLRPWTGCR